MRILDLFCGAGGCSVGYARAGFEVIGVDHEPMPRYPFEFVERDALAVLERFVSQGWALFNGSVQTLKSFSAIHASPPCQAFSALGALSDNEHPDLLGPTRELLEATGLPYVIENVPNAPMRRDYLLCGSMFGLEANGRQLRRHRWFETNWPVGLQPACQHHGQPIGVYGTGGGGQMTRGYKATLAEAREAMGTPWMSRSEVSQAIPPDYTHLVGEHLMQHLLAPVRQARYAPPRPPAEETPCPRSPS